MVEEDDDMVGWVDGCEIDMIGGDVAMEVVVVLGEDVAVDVGVVSVEEDIGMGCCEIGEGGGSEGVEIWLLGE